MAKTGSLLGVSVGSLLNGNLPVPGSVDYRLAKAAVLSDYKMGRLGKRDVCDAHPELLRAAAHLGRPSSESCPICESSMVHVQYAFGSRLPASGRCVSSLSELRKLSSRTPVRCYTVEVCEDCHWNHLVLAVELVR